MILIHEFGHFLSAKLCKIKVESVSFGIGPVIHSFGKKNTKFELRAIPFGGSTKMLGKDDLKMALEKKTKYIEHCEEGSIYSVSPIKRIIVYFAGPFANYIFTIFCFTLLSCLTSISTVYTSKIRLTTDSSNYSTVVSAAEKAGISSGEIITSIDGNIMNDWSDIQNYLSKFDNKTVTITTDTGIYEVTPINGLYGLLPYGETYQKKKAGKNILLSLYLALGESIDETASFISSIKSLILGRKKVSETFNGTLSASLTLGETIETGFSVDFNTGIRTVLYVLGSVSLSLGVANLLPVTILDGGLIVTGLIELLIGKPLKAKTYMALQILGLLTMFILIPILIKLF